MGPPASSPSMQSSAAGSYRTLKTLARGGMGSVDIVVLEKGAFERLFALKRLVPELLQDERAREMLLAEGNLAGKLRHPNIVPVLDVGEDQSGPFIVMELVPGVSLQELFRWAASRRQRLELQLLLRLIRDTCLGLHYAHEIEATHGGGAGRASGIVHRDVSPQNILVGFDGVARVTDFGIAKVLHRSAETTTGILKGKIGYMSPEQLRFEKVDRRSDLFSLGVVLFEGLTGRRLYKEPDLTATAQRILREPPPDVGELRPDLPPAVVELVFELLAKDPADRPSTAKDVAVRLEVIIAELALDGPTDVEGFLRAELSDRYRETLAWGRLAREARDADATATATATVPTPRANRPWGSWLMAGGLGVLTAVAVGLAVALSAPDAPAAPAAPVVEAPTEVTPAPAEVAAPEVTELAAEDVADVTVAAPAEAPEDVTAAAPSDEARPAPEAAPATRRRRPRRGASPRTPTPSRTDPLWDWPG